MSYAIFIYNYELNCKIPDYLMMYCWSLDSIGKTIKEKILQEIQIMKIRAFIAFGLCQVTVIFLHFEILIHEKEMLLNMLDHYFGMSTVLYATVNLSYAFLGYGFGAIAMTWTYICIHIIMQYKLMCEVLATVNKSDNIEDQEYQKHVYQYIKLCADHHQGLKKLVSFISLNY